MRQLLYVSDSRIGDDVRALDRLMVQARANNAIDGITGLLWTDGARFAQVIEGDDAAIGSLLARLRADPRHTAIQVVRDGAIAERAFGEWSMTRPANDQFAEIYEARMVRELARIGSTLGAAFRQVIEGSRPVAAA